MKESGELKVARLPSHLLIYPHTHLPSTFVSLNMDAKNITKHYTNGEVTIVWQSGLCTHSTQCWKGSGGLKEVFNPMEKPWIKPEGASTERIIEQVKKCPSGALSFFMNEES